MEELEGVIAELERGRRDRWLIALTLVLASVAVISLSMLGPDLVDVGPVAIYALLAATVVYGANVMREERRSHRITLEVIAERERRADLLGQVSVLEALDLATRRVTDAEDLPEVVERILQAARGLVGAPLVLGDRLVGVVVLERSPGRPGFRDREAEVLERFGAHAALALRQTSHLDASRRAAGAAPDPADETQP
jgi:GAF domain-containing protein